MRPEHFQDLSEKDPTFLWLILRILLVYSQLSCLILYSIWLPLLSPPHYLLAKGGSPSWASSSPCSLTRWAWTAYVKPPLYWAPETGRCSWRTDLCYNICYSPPLSVKIWRGFFFFFGKSKSYSTKGIQNCLYLPKGGEEFLSERPAISKVSTLDGTSFPRK